VQSLEAFSYLDPIYDHKKLAAHYKGLILQNPAWASAKLVDEAVSSRTTDAVWRFRVSAFEDGVIQTTEHDIRMPMVAACKLVGQLISQQAEA